jgi:aconitate hydratase
MNSFGARSTLRVADQDFTIHRLEGLEKAGMNVTRLPYSLKILLENLLRGEDGVAVRGEDIEALARWTPEETVGREIAFSPARVLLQDFTGVPAVVDLAAMREAMARFGGDPKKINPLQPAELVIDHSVQLDAFGSKDALGKNVELDYQRNLERYAFLRWGQRAFENLKVVPPHTGIVHQVNLEYLARVVFSTDDDRPLAYPDTLVGTDSHTPMVNGLGVLGWGVGGIEAEAAMLGQAISILVPKLIGFRITGALPEGATATDLVLTVAEMLRKKGVVGSIVEFYGPGIENLPLADRATIGNMTPEYGATATMFPVDDETLRYLRFTGRSEARVRLVETYLKEQGMFFDAAAEPLFSDTLELDLSTVEPSLAGPRRPQDRVPLSRAKTAFEEALPDLMPKGAGQPKRHLGVVAESDDMSRRAEEADYQIGHGSVVIAAITSCTNTSNPAVMIAAGLLAKKARERGLSTKPWVKTSLAPGSKVVTQYLEHADLTGDLEALGFHLAGYGCTTCIGNSGPLPKKVSSQIEEDQLVVCSVLSGNRNFEGRIHAEVRANYLASPPLVVAYALAGRLDIDMQNEPLGEDGDGKPVFLRDLWPSQHEVQQTIERSVQSKMFESTYAEVYAGDETWQSLPVPEGDLYEWDPSSTYVKLPPYFEDMPREAPKEVSDVEGARCIALLGDSVTTDHISPAGSIKADSPAGQYLLDHGVAREDFNSYGSRRGNHEVMVRGTFANVRIKNQLAPDTEGGFTTHLPSGEVTTIYEAAMRYRQEGTPTIILGGKEYGSGSSRDWAGKGPHLQGVAAVIVESYERIHRSNLVGMGVLPLEFERGESAESLGLTGHETFAIEGLRDGVANCFVDRRDVTVRAVADDGSEKTFRARVRIDTPQELLYYLHGGILQFVLRQLLDGRAAREAAGCIPASPQPTSPTSHDGDKVDEGSDESFPASDPPAY